MRFQQVNHALVLHLKHNGNNEQRFLLCDAYGQGIYYTSLFEYQRHRAELRLSVENFAESTPRDCLGFADMVLVVLVLHLF